MGQIYFKSAPSHSLAPSILHSPPSSLDLRPLALPLKPPLLRAQRRLGRAAGFFHLGHAANQLGQALQGVLAILFLGAVLLGLDDDHPVGGDAAVAQGQQAFLVEVGQRRGADIEAQVQCAGDLVDVLPAGALGADGAQFDFAVGQFDGIGNVQHGGLGNGRGDRISLDLPGSDPRLRPLHS